MLRLNLNLRNVLFDPSAQKKNIEVMIGTLETAVMNVPPGIDKGLVYGDYLEHEKPTAESLPFRQLLRENVLPDYTDLHTLLDIVKKHMSVAVAQSQPLVLVWIMLLFMFVSTEFRSLVCENTEQHLASSYFERFEERFVMSTFGHVVPKKPRKKIVTEDQILHPCDTPLEIVLKERLLFMRLQRATL